MRGTKSERTKKLVVFSLFGALGVVLIYQLFFSKPTPRPKLNKNIDMSPGAAGTAPTQPGSTAPQRMSASAAQEAALRQQLSDMTPLSLVSLRGGGGSSEPGWRQNMFATYVEPPKKVDLPPPPPIVLQSIQPQTAVAGTPRVIPIQVTGLKMPPDAKIYVDGVPRQSKRVNENQLLADILPVEYPSARTINIDVKSPSNKEQFSNVLQFVVQPAPEPPFKYVGRLGEFGVFEMAGSKEIKRATRGGTLQGVWRVDSITDAGVDVTQTQYDIKRRIPLQEKSR